MAEILIVEDELSINELIRKNLSLTGHHCTQAFDGLSARVEYNCQAFLGFISDTSRKVTEFALEHLFGEVETIETETIEDCTVTWTTSTIK